jgi:hypothetical protein
MRRTVVLVVLSLSLFTIERIELRGQDSPAPTTSGNPAADKPAGEAGSLTNDLFPQERAEALRLKAIYESMSADSMAEIDMLMDTGRCQIARVNGLLNRLKDAMNSWLTAEKQYWKSWDDKESKRVEIEQASLANIEAEQTRAAELVESDKKDREELLRRRAALQQGPQNEAIRAQMDALAADIQDTDAKLSEAQRAYDLVSLKLDDSKASLTVRLVKIRENRNVLDALGVSLDAAYETKRAAAQEICDQKTPDAVPPKQPGPPAGTPGEKPKQ